MYRLRFVRKLLFYFHIEVQKVNYGYLSHQAALAELMGNIIKNTVQGITKTVIDTFFN